VTLESHHLLIFPFCVERLCFLTLSERCIALRHFGWIPLLRTHCCILIIFVICSIVLYKFESYLRILGLQSKAFALLESGSCRVDPYVHHQWFCAGCQPQFSTSELLLLAHVTVDEHHRYHISRAGVLMPWKFSIGERPCSRPIRSHGSGTTPTDSEKLCIQGMAVQISLLSVLRCQSIQIHTRAFERLSNISTHENMANTAINLAKRLRARSMSLPIQSAQTAVSSKQLNVEAAKQRAADWEPTMNFNDLKPRKSDNDEDDNDTELAYMCTCSAFDPGATHPLLLSSSLPISVSSLVGGHASTTSTPDPEVETHRNTVVANPRVQTPPTTSSLHHDIGVQQAAAAVPTPEKFKPWPYSLPKLLQPKAGTTYDLMYGDGVDVGDVQVAKAKLGVLQKVLYGVLEPGKEDEEED
jgi:hypothetical protein